MKKTRKKRSAFDWLPVLLLIGALLLLAYSEYSMPGSQEKQTDSVIGQDQWEYYFTPFYEREQQEESGETGEPVWTMPPVSAAEV